jgi:D-alanyl-D-alanine carboxypeptidase (penicillin-binding protein 5/6)
MKYPEFRDVVRTKAKMINRSMNQEDLMMVNRNKWLRKDATCDGIKTGYTVPAGHCFVGSATRDGYRVITVVLKSENWQEDTGKLLNWAFANHERTLVKPASEAIEDVQVQAGAQPSVPVAPERDVFVTLKSGEPADVTVALETYSVEAPIRAGQRVGSILVTDAEGYQQRIPAVATEDVPRRSILQAAATDFNKPIAGGALLLGILWMRGRSRRRVKHYGRRSARQSAYR